MALFNTPFTNIFWKGEVYPSVYDAEGDYYLVTDAQTDHNYLQEKIWDIIGSLSNSPSTDCQILYGGVVSDGGSGTVNITECVAKGFDSDGNKRIIYIPAQTGISIPSGWNDGRQIYVLARYDYKLGALTRTHKGGTTYHHEMKDTYMGDSNGYVSTGTVDFFTDTPGAITDVVLGRFTMTGTTYADTTSTYRSADVGIVKTSGAQTIADVKTFSSIPVLPASDPTTDNQAVRKLYVDAYHMKYDYIVDSQAKFDALVASGTWFGAKNVLFTTNVTRAAQTTIPATVEKIHAINGATLTVTDLTTGQYGFGYAAVPTDPKFEIRNFAVNATGTGSIHGFHSCTQVTNCTGTGTGGYGYGYGFHSCTQVTNCTGTGTGGYGYGFHSCTQVTNCTATGTGTGIGAVGYGFRSCTQVTNCTATGTGTDGYGYGFHSCTQVTNCTATGTGTEGYGFYSCIQVTNCTGTGTGTGSGYGYRSCVYLSMCTHGTCKTSAGSGNSVVRGCEDIADA
jgi:hypothetical protein